jgi:predicted acylesterase/phospholipase RssA
MIAGERRIGLALSGGGFRATAFGLGALRALHDRDLLRQVRVVSGISGGSILAAMWAYGPKEFDVFDESVTELLATGLQLELVSRAIHPKFLLKAMRSNATSVRQGHRAISRTEALVDALSHREFGAKSLAEVTHRDTHTVISATDLATANAIRFGSKVSSSSPLGRIVEAVSVAEAVAASAAFPALLPALGRTFTFEGRDGARAARRVQMTDGGVYDNLGVTPLLRRRSPDHTAHVYDIDYLISVDAGRGRFQARGGEFFPARLRRSFEISHGRNQDLLRRELNSPSAVSGLDGHLHIYMGMQDDRLPPLPDLVPRARTATYPTNFASVKRSDFDAISIRGEEITRLVIQKHGFML